MTDDPRQVVAAGYDAVAESFADWINEIEGDPRQHFLDELMARLDPGSRVLELGCGAGGSGLRQIAEHHHVTGVDVSAAQVRLARRAVPQAHVIQGDMRDLNFPEQQHLDAVLACYSILHIPREEYAPLFTRIARWLRPGAWFLTSLAAHDDPGGTVDDWLGTPMYFSGFPPETNRRLLTEAGFDLVLDEPITMHEPEGVATFHWLLAQASAQRSATNPLTE